MKIVLTLLICAFITPVFSAPTTTSTAPIPQQRDDRFSVNYNYTKRTLRDTQFARDLREEKIAGKKVFVSPETIVFDQHIIGLRYQATPDLQLEAGTAFMKSEVTLSGQLITGTYTPQGAPPSVKVPIFNRTSFQAGSQGISDTRVGGIYTLKSTAAHDLTLSETVSIPTGSVEEKQSGKFLPYAGQLGSGTYDLISELKYTYEYKGFNAGTRLNYTLRTGRSDRDYRMGNQALWDGNVGYTYNKIVGANLRARVRDWRASEDPRYANPKQTVDDPYVQAGRRFEVLATTQVAIPLPYYVGAMIVEGGVPLYQDQKGGEVQLETDWYLSSRLVASF